MKTNNKIRTEAEWHELTERYWDGLTTEAEERELEEHWLNDDSENREGREMLATMSYAKMRKHYSTSKSHKTIHMAWKSVAAAAVVALAVGSAWNYMASGEAYVRVEGETVYSTELAMAEMHEALNFVGTDIEMDDELTQLMWNLGNEQ